jgi:NEDD8-activating enzyme E1 regulatory subunit
MYDVSCHKEVLVPGKSNLSLVFAIMADSSSSLPPRSATNDKYDRQLRVWGTQGQVALSKETCVILIRATAAGTETCKNCILPGLHHIHILDDEVASTGKDASSNFFLSSEIASTASRAEVVLNFLLELNPDVTGSFTHVSSDLRDFDFLSLFRQLLQQHPHWKKCLVLGSDLERPLLESIARVCLELQLPFLSVHAFGLFGIVQVQTLPLLPIVNPRGQQSTTTQVTAIPEFHILHPFPLLRKFMDDSSSKLDTLSTTFEYGHVPYPILLYFIYHKVWKPKYPDRPKPQTIDEKKEFVQMIYLHYHNVVSPSRGPEVVSSPNDMDVPLNVVEAARNAYMAYTERTVNVDHLQVLLNRLRGVTSLECQTFSVALRAVLQFVQAHQGRPPVHGSIPDMTASTTHYIQLQSIYKQQQIADLQVIKGYLQRENGLDNVVIPEDDYVINLCQNIHDLDVLESETPWLLFDDPEELHVASKSTELCEDLNLMLSEQVDENADDNTDFSFPFIWYLGYEACQLFYMRQGCRYPGTLASDDEPCNLDDDASILQSYFLEVTQRYRCDTHPLLQRTLLHFSGDHAAPSPYAVELVRCGNSEIHAVSSILGGVASQELIKLITGQYIPLNNTYVFNGIAGTGAVYKL